MWWFCRTFRPSPCLRLAWVGGVGEVRLVGVAGRACWSIAPIAARSLRLDCGGEGEVRTRRTAGRGGWAGAERRVTADQDLSGNPGRPDGADLHCRDNSASADVGTSECQIDRCLRRRGCGWARAGYRRRALAWCCPITKGADRWSRADGRAFSIISLVAPYTASPSSATTRPRAGDSDAGHLVGVVSVWSLNIIEQTLIRLACPVLLVGAP